MANAVTHILVVIIILDFFRHYIFGKDIFPRYLLVIGGIAGLAPDLDIPLSYLWSFITGSAVNLHGHFTHSLLFVIIFVILGITFSQKSILKYVDDRRKWAGIFFVISFGWFMHLFLDCLYGGYKSFFWPIQIASNYCPQWGIQGHAVEIDAILLVLWLVHEELHGKIKDYW